MRNICVRIAIFLILISPASASALDRCDEYKVDVRAEHTKQFGFKFPWWYGMGVMRAESNCRASVVSFDGGYGLYQFTPRTGVLVDVERGLKEKINPSNPVHSIRAFAYYTKLIIRRMNVKEMVFKKIKIFPKAFIEKCGLRLSNVYQVFNGGMWVVKEYQVKECCDQKVIRSSCTRGGTFTDKAKTKWLSFCDVNYSYPEKVYKYSQKYKLGNDGGYRYW